MRTHGDNKYQIPGRAAVAPVIALTGQTDTFAVVYAGGYCNAQLLVDLYIAFSVAVAAGVLIIFPVPWQLSHVRDV